MTLAWVIDCDSSRAESLC